MLFEREGTDVFASVSDVFLKNITTPAMHKSNARRAAVFKGLRGLFITLYSPRPRYRMAAPKIIGTIE